MYTISSRTSLCSDERPISQLSVGPEAALSLLVGQLVTDALTADPHHAPKNPEGVAMAIAGITAMQVSCCFFLYQDGQGKV